MKIKEKNNNKTVKCLLSSFKSKRSLPGVLERKGNWNFQLPQIVTKKKTKTIENRYEINNKIMTSFYRYIIVIKFIKGNDIVNVLLFSFYSHNNLFFFDLLPFLSSILFIAAANGKRMKKKKTNRAKTEKET